MTRYAEVDVAPLHAQAVRRFASLVHQIQADQWGNPTPCSEWDVRALVNHVVGEGLWTAPLVAGKTIADVGDAFDGDVLGADPAGAADLAAEEALSAFSADGAMHRTVHLSFGDYPGYEYAWQLFADHLVHGWDLARAIGADERMDPELVAACALWWEDWADGYRSGGAVADPVHIAPDADPQVRLLASFGRG